MVSSWIRSLVYRTKRICDEKLFKEGIRDIKQFASWNGFPRNIRNRLVEKFVNSSNATNVADNKRSDEKCSSFGYILI